MQQIESVMATFVRHIWCTALYQDQCHLKRKINQCKMDNLALSAKYHDLRGTMRGDAGSKIAE
ncbi:hypothetical protein FB480_10843 [Agrobacterium vitis]|nr:hypothetical protein FB480_10843 [Agrobacterium vitis]